MIIWIVENLQHQEVLEKWSMLQLLLIIGRKWFKLTVRGSMIRFFLGYLTEITLKPEKERNYFFHGCENAWC